MPPGRAGRFRVEHHVGSAAELHDLDWPEPLVPTVWILQVTSPALVLGSAARHHPLDLAPLAQAGLEVVVRRSGGGAVVVEPGNGVWLDVVVPRSDPVWVDDVSRSFGWLGRVWVTALASLGLTAEVHSGPPDRGALAAAACFAGLGAGEVTLDGAKAVGLSQRRTRAGARFQSCCYRRWNPEPLRALGLDPADLPPVALLDRDPARLTAALLEALADLEPPGPDAPG